MRIMEEMKKCVNLCCLFSHRQLCLYWLSIVSVENLKLRFIQINIWIFFNVLHGIGIPELLLNLVSCHGFMKKPNSTVILNLQYSLVNKYLENDSTVSKGIKAKMYASKWCEIEN